MDAKKLKAMIKSPAPKATFGTDPKDPWSAKAGISESEILDETAILDRYLLTKGVNPQYAKKDVKVAYSKTNAFKKWSKDHAEAMKKLKMKKANEDFQLAEDEAPKPKAKVYTHEVVHTKSGAVTGKYQSRNAAYRGADKKDNEYGGYAHHVREIPSAKNEEVEQIDELKVSTLLRYNTKAHKSSNEHGVKAARAMDMGDKETWAKHANKRDQRDAGAMRSSQKLRDKLKKEEVEHIDEISKNLANRYMWSAMSDRKDIDQKTSKALEKQRDNWSPTRHKNITKLMDKSDKRSTGINRALNRLSQEAVEADYGGKHQANVLALKAKAEKKPVDMASLAARMQASYKKDDAKKVKESVEQIEENRKAEMSKSARMIKALYKKHKMVKEDLYDHEKDDKPKAAYGKTPKHDKADPKDSQGEKKPKAAAVLTGGTTLTGQKRDDIEIDPMMRVRPGQPDPTKDKDKDKDKDKKDDKKKDK